MKFSQRLFRYLIGVGIGIMISIFFFKDRADVLTGWLPGNRIIDRLDAAYFNISPKADCQLKCHSMDIAGLKDFIQEGKVDFGNSQTKGESKEYLMHFPESEKIRSIRFGVRDSSASIVDLQSHIVCDCP